MAEVRIDQVEKVYQGGVRAVKGISLDIPDGSFVVLVGPSGCGKSTTLRMIAGLEDISGGQISIGDRVVNKVAPKDRDIAMVFQNYALYPHMTVYQNMAFGLKLRKMSKSEIDKRVRDASAILGLDEYLSRKPKALSGGQRQRVAVGRAIVREPACFLFDEPLSNLDAKLRVGMRSELKALHQRLKTTTVYVTHDQEEAMTLGDQVVVMADGVIQQAGSPEEVFRRPVNRFVAGFVGTPPTNFLAGALHGRDGKVIWRESGTNGVELELGPSIADQVRVRAGDSCVIGIRPGSVTVNPSAPEGRTIQSEILVVEPLGEQTDLRTRTASGEPFTARVSSDGLEARVGETVSLEVQPERLMLFEPGEFGASMTTAAAQPLQTG